MSVYKTEEEQVEDLKRWAKSYGPSIIIGILIAAVVIFGYRFYEHHKTNKSLEASVQYEHMMYAAANNQTDDTTKAAKQLMDHYRSTPYASLASFTLAKIAIENKKYDEALSHLTWVMDHSKDKSLQQVARCRVARIYIFQKEPQKALDELATVNNPKYQGLIDEIKGDAYAAMQKPQDALASYSSALKAIPQADDRMPSLRMKMNALETTTKNS